MRLIAAGLAAATFAYVANRFIYQVMGNNALVGPVPLVEETAKTMTAWLLGTTVVYTHVVFGMAEALLDWRGGKKGPFAAASAMAAHSLFGLVTSRVALETGTLGLGILAAALVHAVWNMVMLYRTARG